MFAPPRKVLPLALIWASACGSNTAPLNGTPDAGPNDSGLALDPCRPEVLGTGVEELTRLAEVRCQRQLECNTPVLNQAQELDECVTQQRLPEANAYYAARGSVPSAAAACECRVHYEQVGCTRLLGTTPTACQALYAGPSAAGETCEIPSDCAEGLTCDSDTQCPARCVPRPARCPDTSCPSGEWCDEGLGVCRAELPAYAECLGGRCGAGLYCGISPAGPAEGMRCVPVHEVGEACTMAEGSCPSGYSCQLDSGQARCLALRAEGDGCSSADDCAANLYCDFSVRQCRPSLPLGASCRAELRSCAPGLRCEFPLEASCGPGRGCRFDQECCSVDGVATCLAIGETCEALVGVCQEDPGAFIPSGPLAGPGEPCDGRRCPLGTTCRPETETSTRSVCGPLYQAGTECGSDGLNPYTCERGLCDFLFTARCVEPAFPGEACAADGPTFECVTLQCRNGRCADWSALSCGG